MDAKPGAPAATPAAPGAPAPVAPAKPPAPGAPAAAPVSAAPAPSTPTATPPDAGNVTGKGKVTAADLVRRAAQAKGEAPPAAAPAVDDGIGPPPELTLSDVDKLQDPVAKQVLQDLYKQLVRGFNAKFMTLAEKTKAAETLRQQLEQQTGQPWTPERVLALEKDPNFVAAAQAAIQARARTSPPSAWDGSTEAWSALSEADQQRFLNMEGKVNQLLQGQNRMADQQEHERIKVRYPDYDAQSVEQAQADLVGGKVTQETIKEMIWKALTFDRHVENAYRFGVEDRNGDLQVKIAGSTLVPSTGPALEDQSGKPVQAEGESNRAFFVRLGEYNLSKQRGRPMATAAR